MENIYEICYFGGLIMAILFLITSAVLFIVLKIPKVFGELTGRSASKAIKDMKEGGGINRSVAKREQAKYYNQGSDKIKGRETVSEQKRKTNKDDTTDLLGAQGEEETDVLGRDSYIEYDDEKTTLLSSGNDDTETEVLSESMADAETEVLSESMADTETEVLSGNMEDAETDVLTIAEVAADFETAVLSTDDEESTTVLTDMMSDKLARRAKVSYNIVVTHTDESLQGE